MYIILKAKGYSLMPSDQNLLDSALKTPMRLPLIGFDFV